MKLAEELIDKYGRGFKKSNLYLFVSFYQNHPDFFQLPNGKSLDMADDDIFQSLTGKFPIRLSICTKNYKYGAKICFLL